MFDSIEQIQNRISKLKTLAEKEDFYKLEVRINDKLWQERLESSMQNLNFYRLGFNSEDTQTGFTVGFNTELNELVYISIFIWGEKTIKSEEVVKELLSDKYEIDYQRGGHGGYDLFLKKK